MEQTFAVFLIRYGEVALKGQNKPFFERLLLDRIRRVLRPELPGVHLIREDGLLIARTAEPIEPQRLIRPLTRVFGVESVSPAIETAAELEAIRQAAIDYMTRQMVQRQVQTFKVEAKRSDKTFPVTSPEIASWLGGQILAALKLLKVDVHNPDCRLFVHVRRQRAFLYDEKFRGFGGLPIGTNGKGLVLLSGGIDSPVAAFLMAKRGMRLEAVHFHSFPYTSQRAFEKVKDLAGILTTYCGPIKLHSINLLPVQQAIVEHCPEDEMTILVRRYMMKLAEQIAVENGCQVLITGENLGQVASQTVDALVVTDQAVSLPVMRPLIGADKSDIIEKAQEIGTYELSIQPFEDCCTIFLPKHPKTKPRIAGILRSESRLAEETLLTEAQNSRTTETIN